MLKVKNIGSNMTQVNTTNANILISYETPVACYIPGEGAFKTATKHSVTTSKHINKWLQGATAELRPQEFFDNLLS